MRSILFDELQPQEVAAVRVYLNQQARRSGLEDLYWIALPRVLWNENQIQTSSEGRKPDFHFAVELGSEWVRFELLIRSEGLLNLGGGQATAEQALFLLNWANDMARKLDLLTCTPTSPPPQGKS
ncbi:MAG: hypothetical protein AMR96_05860 [Candidatus Adiutrix intracellularis]|jgi:hypothetical protein|nr:MAG: hypothetical protein AMR96_05860 [Candidatus Adiutrix intracellularis]MDR2826617.1 hypothetical protein [Candidatus Adiutrix intracellularis]